MWKKRDVRHKAISSVVKQKIIVLRTEEYLAHIHTYTDGKEEKKMATKRPTARTKKTESTKKRRRKKTEKNNGINIARIIWEENKRMAIHSPHRVFCTTKKLLFLSISTKNQLNCYFNRSIHAVAVNHQFVDHRLYVFFSFALFCVVVVFFHTNMVSQTLSFQYESNVM